MTLIERDRSKVAQITCRCLQQAWQTSPVPRATEIETRNQYLWAMADYRSKAGGWRAVHSQDIKTDRDTPRAKLNNGR